MRRPTNFGIPVMAMLLALLAGCSPDGPLQIPGPVAQLQRFIKAQTEGRLGDIADATVDKDCLAAPFGSDACPRVHAIRAQACLTLARQEAAADAACPPPTPTARRRLDCAAESYALAGNAAPGGSADATAVAGNRARARYCVARFRPPAEGVSLARAALADLGGLPASPDRDLLAASSALFIAQDAAVPAADRCTATRQAAGLAERGFGAAPDGGELRRALGATRTAARAEAGGIPACGGR